MSPTPLPPAPRLLLFPQVGHLEAPDGRRAVRRYALALLPGAPRVERVVAGGLGARPPAG